MNTRDAQTVLSRAGLYSGVIDGKAGPQTERAVSASERGGKIDRRWGKNRRLVAAGQRELMRMGHEPGPIDGLPGPKTTAAFLAMLRTTGGKVSNPDLSPVPEDDEKSDSGKDGVSGENKVSKPDLFVRTVPNFTIPRRRNADAMIRTYGQPGDANKQNSSGRVRLPFPFRLAWDKKTSVKAFSCHTKVAPVFESLLTEAARHYGEDEFRRLRLDLFGGCYAPRRMRGGAAWSTHAWGIAIDLDPERNQLAWGKERAAFARPEYLPFWRIVEAHKLVGLGPARNYDWMHIQCALEE